MHKIGDMLNLHIDGGSDQGGRGLYKAGGTPGWRGLNQSWG